MRTSLPLTIFTGVTYFLNRVTKEGELDLIWEYVTRYPACEHLLVPLSWDKDKKTYDVVSGSETMSYGVIHLS